MKVHLGCGGDYLNGYINVDSNRSIKADTYADFTKRLPFKTSSVDYVLCKNVFEHIPDPLHFLLEIKRILKKGSKAMIITSNASYIIYHFPRRKGFHDSYNLYHGLEDQHYFLFQIGHLKAFAKKVGMDITRLDYYIANQRLCKDYYFQVFLAFLTGKKYAYSDFLWEIKKR